MEFSLMCNYRSYVIGSRFKVWFSCTCLKPELIEKMKTMSSPENGLSVFQRRVLYALHYGDCRLSYRGSGMISFDGHEFESTPEGDGVRVRFNDECTFLVREQDVTDYTK